MRAWVKQFAMATTTGNQDLTDSRLSGTPDGAIVFWTKGTTLGTDADGVLFGWGCASGTTTADQWSISSALQDNADVATNDEIRRSQDKFIHQAQDDDNTATEFQAQLTSFLSNGIRINWATAPSSAHLMVVVFLENCDCEAGYFNMPDSNHGTVDITTVGFEPDFVLFGSHGQAHNAGYDGSALNHFGVAINTGTGTNQRVYMHSWDALNQGIVAVSSQSNESAIGDIHNDIRYWCSIGSWDSNGFTVTAHDNSSIDGTDDIHYFAVKSDVSGLGFWVDIIDSKTSTGTQNYTGPNFEPHILFLISGNCKDIDTYHGNPSDDHGVCARCWGVAAKDASSGTDQYAMSAGTDAFADPCNTKSRITGSKISRVYDEQDPSSIDQEANLSSWLSTGFQLNWTTAYSTARKWLAFAIETPSTTETGSFTANAVIEHIEEDTFTANAVILRTGFAGSWTANAVLKRVDETDTVTADAVLKRLEETDTFTADAAILQPSGEQTYTADAVLLRVEEDTFTGDAAILKNSGEQTFTADAHLVAWSTHEDSFTADAVVERLSEAATFNADAAILQPSGEQTFTGDAAILRTVGGTFSADAEIVTYVQGSFTARAVILQPSGEQTFTADARIVYGETGDITADAVIFRTYQSFFTGYGVIFKPDNQATFTADAMIMYSGGGTFTADAFIKAVRNGVFYANAVIWYPDNLIEITADAVIHREGSGTFTADAYIVHKETGEFYADAVIHSSSVGAILANAYIVEPGEHVILAEAVILKNSGEQTFTADAAIIEVTPNTNTFTADAVIQRLADAHTFTSNAVIKNTLEGSFFADAYLKSEVTLVEGSFTAYAWIVRTGEPVPEPSFRIEGIKPPNPRGSPKGGGYSMNYPEPKGRDGNRKAAGAVGYPWIEIVFEFCDSEVFDWYNAWVPDNQAWANIDSVQCWDPYATGGAQWVVFDGSDIRIWKPTVGAHLHGYYSDVRILITNLS